MKEYYNILKKCRLFNKIDDELMESILLELGAYVKSYSKNETIRYAGNEVVETGILMSGIVYVNKIDINGNVNIIMELKVGQSFGEMLGFLNTKKSPVNITTATNCTAVLIPIKKLLNICIYNDKYREAMTQNVIEFLAEKGMRLHYKNDILAQKSIREKLMTYFYYETLKLGKMNIKIPFSREGFADYLCVNANSLSRELGKMRDEGIISFTRNHFIIKEELYPL